MGEGSRRGMSWIRRSCLLKEVVLSDGVWCLWLHIGMPRAGKILLQMKNVMHLFYLTFLPRLVFPSVVPSGNFILLSYIVLLVFATSSRVFSLLSTCTSEHTTLQEPRPTLICNRTGLLLLPSEINPSFSYCPLGPPWGKPWRRCHALGEWEGIPRDRYGSLDRDL